MKQILKSRIKVQSLTFLKNFVRLYRRRRRISFLKINSKMEQNISVAWEKDKAMENAKETLGIMETLISTSQKVQRCEQRVDRQYSKL